MTDSALSFVVSDLHLGNRYCCHANFLSWLDSLPADAPVILNGDTLEDPERPLSPQDQIVLDRLVAESRLRPVIWIPGNHDRHVALDDAGEIRFESHWEMGRQLLVTHGHELDDVMPRHSLFRALFKVLHRCLILAGFPNVHVAEYAKKWGFLYRVLNDHVAGKAIREAEARGFAAITCGHTHAAMELKRAGRRYLNTGCWTEEPHYYLRVQGERVDLCVFDRSCRRLEGDSEPSADADGPVDRSLRSRPYAASGGASSSAGDAVGAGSAGTEDSP